MRTQLTKADYQEYWQGFLVYLQENNELFQSGSLVPDGAKANPHTAFSIGYSTGDIGLDAQVNPQEPGGRNTTTPGRSISVLLRLKKSLNGVTPEQLNAALAENRDEIEKELGSHLRWGVKNDNLAADQERRTIFLSNAREDPNRENRRQEQYAWMSDHLSKFYTSFKPRLEALLRT